MLERTDGGWVAKNADDVRAVLGDDRFGVIAAEPGGAVGTIRWLRAAVSRFTNGPEHARRRALVEAELARIDPAALRTATRAATAELLAAERSRAATAELLPATRAATAELVPAERSVEALVRLAPCAALAGLLGFADPMAAAEAVRACAAAYFPGADAETEARADAGTATLLGLLDGVAEPVAVARIALLVQGFDATGALVEAALAHGGPMDAVLRERPPLPAMRRVARTDVRMGAAAVRAGEPVVLDIAAASDPDVLTFGAGLRPCPGEAQARAAAAGVLDALRDAPVT